MPLTIPVAHDFICPWCWIGLIQAKRLKEEFGVEFDWRGFELFPDELEWPEAPTTVPPKTNRPKTPSRFEFLCFAEGIEMPKVDRPHHMRTHFAHEAVEYAKTEGVADALIEALYRAYWLEGQNINDPKVIRRLAKGIVKHPEAMAKAIERRAYAEHIVGFDQPAYDAGVYNVPTFFIGGERYAEQPYAVLAKAIAAAQADEGLGGIYTSLNFPAAPKGRPYTAINMVTTIDGKSITGGRDDSVLDLGSKADHQLLRRLESAFDAVMIGAQTLRATPPTWSPRTAKRIVVSKSGLLPADCAFLNDGEPFVATTGSTTFPAPGRAKLIRAGSETLDFALLSHRLETMGVRRLLVLGGSELNAELLQRGLVDELFLTIAPKVKLGRATPTYAGGHPLDRDSLLRFALVEHHIVGDEAFLRYRAA